MYACVSKAVALSCCMLLACGGEQVAVTIPAQLFAQAAESSVRSYKLWIIRVENEAPQCPDLLARRVVPSDLAIAKLVDPIAGGYESDTISLRGLPAGEQTRIFFVDLYGAEEQQGDIIGSGCTQATIVGGKKIDIDVNVVSPGN